MMVITSLGLDFHIFKVGMQLSPFQGHGATSSCK